MKPLKSSLYCLILCLTFLSAKGDITLLDDTKSYDQIFEKIAEKRLGIDNQTIDLISNPFEIISKKESTKEDTNEIGNKEPSFILQAIVSQKAKINNVWYSKHAQLGEYELVSLGRNYVILKSETEKKQLYIRNQDDAKVKISFK